MRRMGENRTKLVRFALVGLLNTGVDFTVFALLAAAGWAAAPAQVVSYSCGVANSFFWNRSWTFRDRKGPVWPAFLKFAAVNLLALLLSTALLVRLQHLAGLPLLADKLGASAIGVVINYIGSRLWVFAEPIPVEPMKRRNL